MQQCDAAEKELTYIASFFSEESEVCNWFGQVQNKKANSSGEHLGQKRHIMSTRAEEHDINSAQHILVIVQDVSHLLTNRVGMHQKNTRTIPFFPRGV